MVNEQKVKNEEQNAEHRLYELSYHIVPLVGEETLADEVAKVRNAVEKNGGAIFAEEYPKSMTLAYAMSKDIARTRHLFKTSYFGWMKFEADSSVANAVKDVLEANDNILRFLLVKTVRDIVSKRRPLVSRPPSRAGSDASRKAMSKEEMDQEIERLVVE